MKIVIEFNSWEEMEIFRTSGKKVRGKSQMNEVEEAVEVQASRADPTDTRQQIEKTAQAIRDAQPVQAAFQAATPPPPSPPPSQGFPGGNGTQPVNPLVKAIWDRIDSAIQGGQPTENVVIWFRNQIGPDASQATLEQIKQVFIPRMSEQQLHQIIPLLGINVQR